MNKIAGDRSNTVIETIVCSQRVENSNKSIDKYKCVKVTNTIQLFAPFGLMNFRSLFGVNLCLTDRSFSPNSHFVSLLGNAEDRPELLKTDRFATMSQILE